MKYTKENVKWVVVRQSVIFTLLFLIVMFGFDLTTKEMAFIGGMMFGLAIGSLTVLYAIGTYLVETRTQKIRKLYNKLFNWILKEKMKTLNSINFDTFEKYIEEFKETEVNQ